VPGMCLLSVDGADEIITVERKCGTGVYTAVPLNAKVRDPCMHLYVYIHMRVGLCIPLTSQPS
jgi:hypothetical protein